MSYESYLCNIAEAIFAKAEYASQYRRSLAFGWLFEQADLVWDKAMKAAAHAA